MNRMTEYIKSQTAVRTELTIAESALDRGSVDKALRHAIAAMRALLTAQSNVAHMSRNRKPPRSKLAPQKPALRKYSGPTAGELKASLDAVNGDAQ